MELFRPNFGSGASKTVFRVLFRKDFTDALLPIDRANSEKNQRDLPALNPSLTGINEMSLLQWCSDR